MNRPELQDRYQLPIRGQWRDASDSEFFTTKCPAGREKLAECTQAAKEDVDDAVREARKASRTWKKVPTSEHAAILNKITDIVDANTEHLAMVESLSNGKPIRETMAIDIPLSVKHFRYFAGYIATEEDSVNILDEQLLSLISREPTGVVEQIAPWSSPLLMAAWKLALVLTAGCCSVFRPSSNTSLSVPELACLVQDIIPKDILNVITDSGSESGQYVLDHKGFRKLALIGSTEVGRQVALVTADRLVPATLELGGRSVNIFFLGRNWRQAIDGLQLGILFNQGRVCCAGPRVFVYEDIYDKFLEDAIEAFNNVKVGVSWDPKTQISSQINERQLEKTLNYVGIGRQKDARLACGGGYLTEGELVKSCFICPTLLTDMINDMCATQEEIFGPVACILKFKGEDEVIHMTNGSAYGPSDAVQTHDLNRAVHVSRGIEIGRIWVNTYNQISGSSPFGGYKESGVGREIHRIILEHYTQMRGIMINLSRVPSGFCPAK